MQSFWNPHLVHQHKHEGVLLLDDLAYARKEGCHQFPTLRKPFAEEAVRVDLDELSPRKPGRARLLLKALTQGERKLLFEGIQYKSKGLVGQHFNLQKSALHLASVPLTATRRSSVPPFKHGI